MSCPWGRKGSPPSCPGQPPLVFSKTLALGAGGTPGAAGTCGRAALGPLRSQVAGEDGSWLPQRRGLAGACREAAACAFKQLR